jgi:transglutaminase-like putative cysteine protease
MQLHIRHVTHYVYEETVSYSIQSLKLTPRAERGQRVLAWRITLPGERLEQIDPYGNLMHVVTLSSPIGSKHRRRRSRISDVAEATPETSRLSPLTYLAPTSLTRPDAALCPRRPPFGRTPPRAGRRGSRGQHPHVVAYTWSHRREPQRFRGAELGVGVSPDQAHVLVACCRAAGIPPATSAATSTQVTVAIASHACRRLAGRGPGLVQLDVTHAEETGGRHCRPRSAATTLTLPRFAA